MTANQEVYVVTMPMVNGMNKLRPIFPSFPHPGPKAFYAQHKRLYNLKLRDAVMS